jgi:DNA-binding transcriptional ArsR family regulator
MIERFLQNLRYVASCTGLSKGRLTARRGQATLRYMPKRQSGLDRMFHALADQSRRAVVERLVRGPASMSELARPFDMALPTVLQHLGVLESAGIVISTKVGRVRTYQLATDALTPAADWISRQRLPAERRLDRLEAQLSDAHPPPGKETP